jgi:uncharacterized protein (TIGR02646 family)
MIFVNKSQNIPEPLKSKQQEWENKFFEKFEKGEVTRPNSYQYGGIKQSGDSLEDGFDVDKNNPIKKVLWEDGKKKCYFCERKIEFDDSEVEHYIEINDNYKLALQWSNLYISCKRCNSAKKFKAKNELEQALNPCDSQIEPLKHLRFENYKIRSVPNSKIGEKTIEIFQLDRSSLDKARADRLFELTDFLEEIVKQKRPMTEFEEQKLISFCDKENEFSLMFLYRLKLKFPELFKV